MESSHEFTRKRLVEMEDTLVKKTSEMGGEVKAVQVEKCDGLLQHIQMLGIFCEGMDGGGDGLLLLLLLSSFLWREEMMDNMCGTVVSWWFL